VVGAAAAIVIAWVGAELSLANRAPFALLPIVQGIGLGAALAALARASGEVQRGRIVGAAIGLAIVLVAAEHLWMYYGFRREWQRARAQSAEVALFRAEEPWSPAEYFGRQVEMEGSLPRTMVHWSVDAALVVAGAVGAAWSLGRKPE
jgi:hypothetical protein